MAKFLSKYGKFYMRDGKLLRPTNILEVPIVTTNLTYNGKSQSPTIYGYDENTMTMGGVTSGTNVGTYQITFTPKSGYEWADGSSDTKNVYWAISKAAGSLSLSTNSLTIDANSTTGSFTVTRAGDGAISASSNNTGIATVSVSGTTVTVTKVGQGSATITVSVAEGTIHTAPASKTCTVTTSFITASTAAISGVNYTSGLPTDWNIMKEIAKLISETSGSINANTTGSVYVNNGNMWAYKITPGDTISVNNDTYAVMGFNNFALTNQGNYGGTHNTAGLTFGAVDCIGTGKMNYTNTNSGGWRKCLMRTSAMPTLQSGMPATLAQVRVPYVDYDNQNVVLYSDDYMFLPAAKEVHGTSSFSPEAEANALTQFAYYKNGGSKIKSFSGSNVGWWLRSVPSKHSDGFCFVGNYGSAFSHGATVVYGVAPCFCV